MKPVIQRTLIIGYHGNHTDRKFLEQVKAEFGNLGKRIHYDMQWYPERGDAVDAIEQGVECDLVVALHIFGLGGPLPYKKDLWYYNKRNNDLWLVCGERGIPLVLCGGTSIHDGMRVMHPFKPKEETNVLSRGKQTRE